MSERLTRTVITDKDNTITDMAPYMLSLFNKLFLKSFRISEIKTYSFLWTEAKKYDPNLNSARITLKLTPPNLLSQLPPTPGAVEFIKRLNETNLKTVLATSRPDRQMSATIQNLEENFPNMFNQVFMQTKGVDKNGFYSKRRAISQTRPLVFFDDDAQLLQKLANDPLVISDIRFGLIEQPWNISFKEIRRDGDKIRRFGFFDKKTDNELKNWRNRDYEWDRAFEWVNELAQKAEI